MIEMGDSVGPTRLLSRRDVQSLLDVASCIEAVESAFRLHAAGATIGPAMLGTHVAGGGFHVKVAGVTGSRGYYAAKVNANFPENPRVRGLPTIQGVHRAVRCHQRRAPRHRGFDRDHLPAHGGGVRRGGEVSESR